MRSTKGLSVHPEEIRPENRVLGMSVFRGQEDEEEVGKEEKIQDTNPGNHGFLGGGVTSWEVLLWSRKISAEKRLGLCHTAGPGGFRRSSKGKCLTEASETSASCGDPFYMAFQ